MVAVSAKDDGARPKTISNGNRPPLYMRTTDWTGSPHLREVVEMVMPGDNTDIHGVLIPPVAISKRSRFAIREGGRTVGAGTITDIVE